MSDLDRRRHARHLLLPEIGEQGQARLCETRVLIPDSSAPPAAAIARDYLTRAGLHVTHVPLPVPVPLPSPVLTITAPVPSPAAVRTLAGRPELEHAAAALAGAFAAVEAIKAALDLPRSALPAGLSLGGEPSP